MNDKRLEVLRVGPKGRSFLHITNERYSMTIRTDGSVSFRDRWNVGWPNDPERADFRI